MKKTVLLTVLLALCIMLFGCDGDKNNTRYDPDENGIVKNEQTENSEGAEEQKKKEQEKQQILNDLALKTDFENLEINVEKFEIIKRKTDEVAGTDDIYVHIEGSNERLEAVRNYHLQYQKYNEGWIVETVQKYSDEEHSDSTLPLIAPDVEMMRTGADMSHPQYAEFLKLCTQYLGSCNFTYHDGVTVKWEKRKESASFFATIEYDYYLTTEIIDYEFIFRFVNFGEEVWDWEYIPSVNRLDRNICLTDRISGTWYYTDKGYHEIKISIYKDEETEDEAWVEAYVYNGFNGSFYWAGTMILDVSYRTQNTGGSIKLKWKYPETAGDLSEMLFYINPSYSWEDYINILAVNSWPVVSERLEKQ